MRYVWNPRMRMTPYCDVHAVTSARSDKCTERVAQDAATKVTADNFSDRGQLNRGAPQIIEIQHAVLHWISPL